MVTITDIAVKAGVSRATVSYVLNKRGASARISEETRRRVQEAAIELGYRRNELARAVTTGKSKMLGFWVMESQHEPVARVLAGAMKEADASDYFIKMLGFDNESSAQRIIEQCIEWRLAGLIAIHASQAALDHLQPQMAGFAVPMILVECQGPRAGSLHITSDQTQGVRSVVEHLVALGHRKIAYVTGRSDTDELLSYRRADAYRQVMTECGLAAQINVVYGNWDTAHTEAETRRLLSLPHDSPQRPTAIACWSDLTAMVVVRTAVQMGVRVPAELSVTGFDDLTCAALYNPPLTTVAQSFEEIGSTAVRRLLRGVRERRESGRYEKPTEELLPVRLIVRGSTAPVPVETKPIENDVETAR